MTTTTHDRMISEITIYHRRLHRSTASGLALMFEALEEAEKGKDLRNGINRCFNDRLRDRLLKICDGRE